MGPGVAKSLKIDYDNHYQDMKCFTLYPLLLAFLLLRSSLALAGSDSTPRMLVHLLDYLARDYAGAVSDGKIISESEYREQLEFVETVNKTQAAYAYPPTAAPERVRQVTAEIAELREKIHNKADASEVARLATHARTDVIELSGIVTQPAQTPDLERGADIYLHRCSSCHGQFGYGDGVTGKTLNPKPINFHDAQIMKEISALQAFHAIRLGVHGTAMVAQPDLSDQDTWNVAYYALSFITKDANKKSPDVSLGDSSLRIARVKLQEAANSYRLGRLDVAQERALAAYLEGFEPLEPKLRANDPSFVAEIESQMMKVREAIDHHEEIYKVDLAIQRATQKLDEVQERLKRSEMSPWMAFCAAAAILLREGFEAVLVVLAFLGVVRTSGSKRAERWLHGGWMAAVALGVLAWFFSGWLIGISGAQRETMEAVTAFFASAVLLFVGFWLHQKTEIRRWHAFVQDRVKSALEQKSLVGLASISFVAVFRETLEVVLFLRAIWVDCNAAARTGMLAGMLASFLVVLILAWITLRFSRKVPIRQLFATSSLLMAALAVMLLGNGLHSLQEIGKISITAAPISISSAFFGIFPTWETLLPQMALLILIFFLWALGKRRDNVG